MKAPLLLVGLMGAATLFAEVVPHLGYVYPAGAQPGETVQVQIGGQYLKDTYDVVIAGRDVQAEMTGYTYEVDRQANNRLRNMKEKIEAAMAEEEDEALLEQMQYQLGQIGEQMDMAMMMRKEMRQNPEQAKKKQFNPQLAEQVEVHLTLPADLPPGPVELRLIATNGISNPLIFHIGSSLPEVLETEPNSVLDEASVLGPLPLVVNGQMMPGDVDCFRFRAEKGQMLVFRVHARSLVPYLADAVPGWFQAVLTLYDENGREIQCCDDYRFAPDPVMVFDVPADGTYLLKLNDSIYRGRRDFVYRIEMGELPFIESIFPLGGPEGIETTIEMKGINLPFARQVVKSTADAPFVEKIMVEAGGLFSNTRLFQIDELPETLESEPNNEALQAQPVTLPLIVNGHIDNPGDEDWFRFDAKRHDDITLEVKARRLGSPLDARLILIGPDGGILSVGDDLPDRSEGLVTHHADAVIVSDLPATGTYTVRLDDLQGKGGDPYAYRLRIAPAQPDFCLRVTPSGLRLPRDGSAVATVHVVRKNGFDGPIELSLIDPPAGIEMEYALIPAGEDRVKINLSAQDDVDVDLASLHIEGCGRIGIRSVTRTAVAAEDQMQAFLWRHLVPAEQWLVMLADPDPVTVELDLPHSGLIEARPGETFSLPVEVSYHDDVKKGYVRFALSEPPEWLTLGTKGVNRTWPREVTFNVSPNAEVGDTSTLLLTGDFNVQISEDDPRYNPVLKWMNSKKIEFPIAAVPVRIVD